MSDPDPNPTALEERIALLEDNLHDLVEQAAAYSGAGDEDLASDRIAEVERELEALKQQRDRIG